MMQMEEGGLPAKKRFTVQRGKTLHLCKIETKTKSNRFKMLKSVHKSKPNKIHGRKFTCEGRAGRQKAADCSRRRKIVRFSRHY